MHTIHYPIHPPTYLVLSVVPAIIRIVVVVPRAAHQGTVQDMGFRRAAAVAVGPRPAGSATMVGGLVFVAGGKEGGWVVV